MLECSSTLENVSSSPRKKRRWVLRVQYYHMAMFSFQDIALYTSNSVLKSCNNVVSGLVTLPGRQECCISVNSVASTLKDSKILNQRYYCFASIHFLINSQD